MPAHSPPSPALQPSKRARQSSPDKESPSSLPTGAGAGSPTQDQQADGTAGPGSHGSGGKAGSGGGGQSSNFRNVSACNRCRLRKNRCDQRLPSCASCEKANVPCVGYDPITKREIPRSYVYYLETRVEQLEALLSDNNIPFPPAESLEYSSRRSNEPASARSPRELTHSASSEAMDGVVTSRSHHAHSSSGGGDDPGRLHKLVTRAGLSGVPDAANPRYLGSTSGVSFARVVFAAVQSSVSDQKSTSSEKGSAVRPYKAIAGNSSNAATGTSMRDSFFGLHTKPTIHPAPFPDRALGRRLVTLYFEHANPQIPVLHRGNFMHMFDRAYADDGSRVRGPRELYMLNMVFAIGGGIILGDGGKLDDPRQGQAQPEEYHASAIVHLEACLSNSGGGLEELQAVLLLANFALLRPVPPGLWYIIGVAVRLAVDLGLYYEDGKDPETGLGEGNGHQANEVQLRERGRREFVRDMRRRLWWCTYSFDRLVSVCVGRPFGVSDQVITTEFPSLLEDRYISHAGLVESAPDPGEPTYKLVAHHYFRLRLLQSEILQVLQFQQAQVSRAGGQNSGNPYMHTDLPSPFLSRYESFRTWRGDIDRRLYEWKSSAPVRAQTGVQFSTEFLDLNYWQAIIMLYRQSLSVPAMFEGEYHTSKEVESPTVYSAELREDEDRVYIKVAEAGQRILRLYRQLHLIGLVNYTYLATHHLFMAGISYLYAIWHSPTVRSRLTMDEVDFTILAATSVFTDLIEKCPPAEACRDAFDRTAKATVRMANSTGGFGRTAQAQGAQSQRVPLDQWSDWAAGSDGSATLTKQAGGGRPPAPRSVDLDTQHSLPPYDGSPPSDVYSHATESPLLQTLAKPRFRSDAYANVKTDPDGRQHAQPLIGADASDAAAIDPSLFPPPPAVPHHASPTVTMPTSSGSPPDGGTPADAAAAGGPKAAFPDAAAQAPRIQPGFLAPQQVDPSALSPGSLSFADLQGMDFLQSLSATGGGGAGVGTGTEGGGLDGDLNGDTQMDLGFGLGWEGLHHDFSDGQQVDLFDGFFFGGQQGGAGGAGGMGM